MTLPIKAWRSSPAPDSPATRTQTRTLPFRALVFIVTATLPLVTACTPTPAETPTPTLVTASPVASPSPAEPSTSSASPTPAPTTPDARQSQLKTRYGDYPPRNLDHLKSLRKPTFPDTLDGYTLTRTAPSLAEIAADYTATDRPKLGVILTMTPLAYSGTLQSLTDIAYYGNAVCGSLTSDTKIFQCLMAGRAETLEVYMVRSQTEEEKKFLTEWIQKLYDAL